MSRLSFIDENQVDLPDVEITERVEGDSYHMIAGILWSLAVSRDGVFIGWIMTDVLGYKSAGAWQANQNVSGEVK